MPQPCPGTLYGQVVRFCGHCGAWCDRVSRYGQWSFLSFEV